ncbi:MAG TPA: NAD(P)-dependent oxidoreductase [Stellaceae bacterium]|jgi:3-hydroxyisobutyrate dehydrogenase-like beta-hydroxyacid dehydrogenase|nr:NAD(P)-dependent oxidoreductase [Stellaceae bacterium]
MRIGFVGTGTMGTPIASCLIAAGHELVVYDARAEATAALVGLGARPVDRASAAAREAEAVFTSLPGPKQVEEVVFAPRTGILAGMREGGVYVDLTTNSPGTIRKVAEACAARGVTFFDAPVSGRPPNMTVMVGGEAAAFAEYRGLFEAIGKNVFHVGSSGAGCVAKLTTQYMGYANFIASLEGMLIAAKAGVNLDVLAKIVPVSAGQSRTFDNVPRGVLSGNFESGGTLDIVAKDIDLACELAREVGAPAALGAAASDVYKRAQAQGWGQEGFPVVVRILEAMAGARVRSRDDE